jgi:hypothetical protein
MWGGCIGALKKRRAALDCPGVVIMVSQPLWGRTRPKTDRRLKSSAWKKTREYWRAVGKANEVPCWRCNGGYGPILYDVWYVAGTRRVHPLAYVLGHRISRDLGASLGYDPNYLDSIENTHPEHSRCSARSGYMAQSGKRKQVLASAQTAASTPRKSGKRRAVLTSLPPRPVKQAAAADRW